MESTTIASLTELRAFLAECQQFEATMKKSMSTLKNALKAAGANWKDDGYRNIVKMTANIDDSVMEIEKTVTTKIIPFVEEQIRWLKEGPY